MFKSITGLVLGIFLGTMSNKCLAQETGSSSSEEYNRTYNTETREGKNFFREIGPTYNGYVDYISPNGSRIKKYVEDISFYVQNNEDNCYYLKSLKIRVEEGFYITLPFSLADSIKREDYITYPLGKKTLWPYELITFYLKDGSSISGKISGKSELDESGGSFKGKVTISGTNIQREAELTATKKIIFSGN
jgi:hypothetical protein